jgi:hypothetical protein
MRSFRTPWGSSRSSRTSRVDLADTVAFPELDGVVATPTDIIIDLDDAVPARPWYIPDVSDLEPVSLNDTLLPGWILMTSDDARNPIPKPTVDLGTESDDDEDTMPMTTAKSSPKPKTGQGPVVEWTAAELLELFRIDVARHDREVADRENDPYDDYSEDDDLEWKQRTDAYFGTIDDCENEEEGGEEDEYYEYD